MSVITKDKLFIGGQWVAPAGTSLIEVISPHTEEVIAKVPEGTNADIDLAVAKAREAFDRGPWPRTTPAERAEVMAKLSQAIQARSQEFADVITDQNGSPSSWSLMGQVFSSTMVLDFYTGLANTYQFEEERQGLFGPALVRKEPVGVAAAIVPWNVPLFVTMLKLGPALCAGATVVLKPAPETPVDSYLLAECIAEAGVPDGVINIVAAGREVGEYLVTHPDIDKVGFTGSTAVGKHIAKLCGERLRRFTLELGGKSAAIILDDADIGALATGLLPASMMNNGQACVAQTRVLASREKYDEVVDALTEGIKALKLGDPKDPQVAVGPLVAKRQQDRVLGYIEKGKDEGGEITVGGGKGMDHGWYIEPTRLPQRRQQDDDRAGRDLRSGRRRYPLRRRERRDQHRQRLAVRPVGNGMEQRHRPRVRDSEADPYGHDLDQRLHARLLMPVRWVQELRHGTRARARGLGGLPRDEDGELPGRWSADGRQLSLQAERFANSSRSNPSASSTTADGLSKHFTGRPSNS